MITNIINTRNILNMMSIMITINVIHMPWSLYTINGAMSSKWSNVPYEKGRLYKEANYFLFSVDSLSEGVWCAGKLSSL